MDRINEILTAYKYPLLLCLVGVVLISVGSFSAFNKPQPQKELPQESMIKPDAGIIKIDVSGAVTKPGVYSLNKESRVDEAIKLAGGLQQTADPEYISKNLNLSQKVSDGQKIYIPFKGEKISSSVMGISTANAANGATNQNGKINLNTASQSELESLPSIGPATATKIINARPFANISDLTSKKAVGKAVYDKIKELVEI